MYSNDELAAMEFLADLEQQDLEHQRYVAECELDQLVAMQPEQLGAGCKPLPIHFRDAYGIDIPF
ncbi:hypothetical protein [uncultured Marinobacter sp.]|uniref:hypothetical protein n=1 Tax=uncultured Marinobacter sp. TaxID=187379 RepID=UPI0025934187|nr:hypothetical protein [uncultured Marinobacter sp.]